MDSTPSKAKEILSKTLAEKLHNAFAPTDTGKVIVTLADLVKTIIESLNGEGFEIVEKRWLKEIDQQLREIHSILMKKEAK